MMAISYDRIALKGIKDDQLRITFDENIKWRTDHLDLKYGNVGTGQDITSIFFAMTVGLATGMGSLYRLTYAVTMRNEASTKAMIDKMRQRNGNLEISCSRPVAVEGGIL